MTGVRWAGGGAGGGGPSSGDEQLLDNVLGYIREWQVHMATRCKDTPPPHLHVSSAGGGGGMVNMAAQCPDLPLAGAGVPEIVVEAFDKMFGTAGRSNEDRASAFRAADAAAQRWWFKFVMEHLWAS